MEIIGSMLTCSILDRVLFLSPIYFAPVFGVNKERHTNTWGQQYFNIYAMDCLGITISLRYIVII